MRLIRNIIARIVSYPSMADRRRDRETQLGTEAAGG